MSNCASTPESVFSSRNDSWRMFNRIVRRYDLLNRLLSFRLDASWRAQVARMLPEGDALEVLDLATGTGEMALAVLRETPRAKRVYGLDMAANMLARAKEKLERRKVRRSSPLMRSDAAAIPAADASFDAVTMGFGIRNMASVPDALRETRRVLRPGGRALILEFSLPKGPFCWVYLFYLRHILTRIGALCSGDAHAYRYLNRTIENFPCGEAFCTLMRDAGFRDVRAVPLTFGVATIYVGER